MTTDKTTRMIASPAEAAAWWWSDKLAGPTRYDNRDRSETGILTLGLAAMVADKVDAVAISEEQLEAFRKGLKMHIEIRQTNHPNGLCILGVDYGPCLELAEAAELAGINPQRFPWKTNCWIWPDHFVVSDGYAAPHILVWAAPGYEQPPCGQQRYEGHEMQGENCGLLRYHEGDHGGWQSSPLCALCERPTPESWHNHHDHPFTPPRGGTADEDAST